MSSYYANAHLDAYARQLAGFEDAHAAWEATVAAEQQRNADAEADGPEPQLPPEPVQPERPAVTYTKRELTEPEEIKTEYGPALAMPPQLVVTSSNGWEFAMSKADFERSFTDAGEPLPEAKR